MDLGDRVVRPPPRPEPVRDRQEVSLEYRLQHELQRCLDHPVGDHGNAQLADLPRATGLGDRTFAHRQRAELSRLQRVPQILQEPGHPDALPDPAAVRPSTPGVFAPRLPATRMNASISVAGSCTKLNRSSNRRPDRPPPNGGAWPASPIPAPRELAGSPAGAPAFTGASFGLAASSSPRYRCRPSPCAGLSPARSTTAAPPRPGPISRRRTQPGCRAGRAETGRPGTVPVSTAIRSPEEEPGSAPAASLQVRRRPSPQPPRHRLHGSRRVPRQDGCAPLPAQIHQVRASTALRGVMAPVPLVLLSGCSPGLRHLAVLVHPGFVRTAPTPPGASRDRLSSAPARPLRRPDGGGLSPPLESQRLTAHEASPERVRDHLRRPLPGPRNLLAKTAGNTVNEIGP